jgi:hypothetical protein
MRTPSSLEGERRAFVGWRSLAAWFMREAYPRSLEAV